MSSPMTLEWLLGAPYDHAVACLAEAGGDLEALPVEVQTLLVVESAQTMVETGGLAYFYETDFPNNPPYSLYVDAYRRIGAVAAADCLEASLLMFPFAEPHLFEPLRQLWLEKLTQDADGPFARLGAQLAADASVWEKLQDYVRSHEGAFRADSR
jgi:hypothetical protein